MILRSLTDPPRGPDLEPIWTALERSQRQDFSAGCWMVPQPAHAATSGDIARQLSPKTFPGITPEVARAIALHDAGWSPDDAASIQESRAKGAKAKPYSFVAAPTRDVVSAWAGSIDIAGKGSPIGAYLVSLHFSAIAAFHRAQAEPKVAQTLAGFVASEEARRHKLRNKLPQTDAELQRLLEALQFADLLSLYVSAGLTGSVVFPQQSGGKAITLTRTGDTCRLSPNPFSREASFLVAAMRHPRSREESSRTFALAIVN